MNTEFAVQLVRWRRELHARPEAGHQEVETARYLAGELESLDVPFRQGVAGTGLLACLQSGQEGPCVLLRADMDGLPITEQTGAEYASRNPGWMHACGHDAHMACLLGAIRLLKENTVGLPAGRVLALFQPAEEVTPGGAEKVAASGLLQDEQVAAVLGQHVDHEREVGRIGVRPGAMMAQADEFLVRFSGPGGHASDSGSRPDPLAAAVRMHERIPEELQHLPDISADPVLLHVGSLHAGTAANVIPVEAVLTGTARSYETSASGALRALLEDAAGYVARREGVSSQVTWRSGGPPVRNDPALVEVCRSAWSRQDAIHGVEEIAAPSLAAEDFGHLLARVPGVYWRLGIRGPDRGGHPWHTPHFDLDERALPAGAAALAAAASAVLEHLVGGQGG